MPPRIDLEPYKDEILDLLSQKTTHQAIRDILYIKYDITVGRTTLKKALSQWSVSRTSTTTKIEIQDRVQQLLPRYNTQDILRILATEGTPSSEATIRRIRHDLGIKLRLSPEERQHQLSDLEAILTNENNIGDAEDFGRRTRYRHIRAMGLYYTEYSLSLLYFLKRKS